jgi:hypothetical protein
MTYLTEHDNATLAQMKEKCPVFFENGDIDGHAETFNVRKNHLITTNAVGKIRVWQFYWNGAIWHLRVVWAADSSYTTAQAIHYVESKLNSGEFPKHKWGK